MLLPLLAVVAGLALLIWSADRFVEGAAATATHAGMPPLLIGMVIIGFGTSAPEMVVSALAALQGNPALALGNAFGSNIANIALVLGTVAVISPIAVQSKILRKELPLLAALTLLVAMTLLDGEVARAEAWGLLAVFGALMGWTIYQGIQGREDVLAADTASELEDRPMALKPALFWLVLGLVLLILSSRLLVWGAVEVATGLGVSDLIIGLTIVAIGTSLPELASSIAAVRKGEHDLALGNVIGSNIFNTLAVVGIAGTIQPIAVAAEVLYRDWALMMGLTLVLFIMGYGFRGPGRINRFEGALLLLTFIAYTSWLAYGVIGAQTLGA
ncbi:calcium/sodium antiporter [Motiliproteus sp. SC1-56]|uniref:calcium/sodium antiporter n=1 Tax=Motiliproteus sp. SC1-56 TaxID=2799565 RepID=UPI001A902B71|nr:calcium/sodium antiporter [Motiliproteus sp. SC1-56]